MCRFIFRPKSAAATGLPHRRSEACMRRKVSPSPQRDASDEAYFISCISKHQLTILSIGSKRSSNWTLPIRSSAPRSDSKRLKECLRVTQYHVSLLRPYRAAVSSRLVTLPRSWLRRSLYPFSCVDSTRGATSIRRRPVMCSQVHLILSDWATDSRFPECTRYSYTLLHLATETTHPRRHIPRGAYQLGRSRPTSLRSFYRCT
ncbi:hypothetical protein EV126DRAFT_155626 [Verticillium dahliae]|nr:hypothetical protein EV126DRAFT_155626 [Verticillium dahliae]